MNTTLAYILAIGFAIAGTALFMYDSNTALFMHDSDTSQPVEVQEPIPHRDEVPDSLRTYTPPPNIYLPDLLFLRIDAGDGLGVTQCKNMTFRTVDDFSRRINSNLVRADKKLYTLARITYNACLELQIAMFKG